MNKPFTRACCSLSSTELPSGCVSFFDLPAKAPLSAPKTLRLRPACASVRCVPSRTIVMGKTYACTRLGALFVFFHLAVLSGCRDLLVRLLGYGFGRHVKRVQCSRLKVTCGKIRRLIKSCEMSSATLCAGRVGCSSSFAPEYCASAVASRASPARDRGKQVSMA